MATTYEIIKAIHQAAADGGIDHPYGGKDTGALEREKGHIVNDSRVWDGFKINIGGNILMIKYHSECTIKETHEKDFEEKLEDKLEQLASFLKKEYKAIMGSALTLKATEDEMDARIQEVSRHKAWVQACKYYEIGNIEKVDDARKDRKDIYDDIDDMGLNESLSPEKAWRNYLNGSG